MSKATHVVIHPKQFMAVKGKLQHVPKGTEVTLAAKHGERLAKRGRVMVIGQKAAVDLTAKAPTKVAKAEADAKAAGINA